MTKAAIKVMIREEAKKGNISEVEMITAMQGVVAKTQGDCKLLGMLIEYKRELLGL